MFRMSQDGLNIEPDRLPVVPQQVDIDICCHSLCSHYLHFLPKFGKYDAMCSAQKKSMWLRFGVKMGNDILCGLRREDDTIVDDGRTADISLVFPSNSEQRHPTKFTRVSFFSTCNPLGCRSVLNSTSYKEKYKVGVPR